MTHGSWNGDPFGVNAPPTQRPPQPARTTSILATLSVVFAFVFAPVGAVLGHLALAQDRGGDHSRDHSRALVGLTVSYTVIVVTVVAVVIWAVAGHQPSPPPSAAATTTSSAPARTTTTTTTTKTKTKTKTKTTTTTTTTKPPPTVAPADLPSLLLSLDEVRGLMATPSMTTTTTSTELEPDDSSVVLDPAECALATGAVPDHVYRDSGYQALLYRHDDAAQLQLQVQQDVIIFRDAAGAHTFATTIGDGWGSCAGRRLTQTQPGKDVYTFTVGQPAQTGAITSLRNGVSSRGLNGAMVLTVAAKANVVLRTFVFAADPADQATTMAARILDRIPS